MSEIEKNRNNPLHGIKLKDILEELVKHYGWKKLGKIIVKCLTIIDDIFNEKRSYKL
ncbi:MAG: VF530 family DNA-binding protein [Campylobacterota bacterium]|nr:VF530 family DNA-binding protein [Campylobacterota bacterium]